MQTSLFENESKGAEFSPCRKWRYALWRFWEDDPEGDIMGCIGLNPSVANEHVPDPTLKRVVNFAQQWGYSGVYMLNAFAFVTSYPTEMKAAHKAGIDPVGPDNNAKLVEYAAKCEIVVAAWGNDGAWLDRDVDVINLPGIREKLFYLKLTAACQPNHPLYLPKTTKPKKWTFS